MGIVLRIQDLMIKDIRYIFLEEAVKLLFNLRKIILIRELWKM